ncbi:MULTISPECIES: M23 family metallopeptidase [Cellulophaga]|uniref:Peptidase M23 n=2 Tax=Cellulophaga TaxID=104264 RepID=F0RFB5_CELLC|nr:MULTISPECIES: M23 family metallopeptidase [Cellulophaga]ADY27857.1 Peptidase M23 [Cellulophaga lytica DSM 7489]EWH13479.1 peptidase M23 [Cellulophaga geojensis KL-A]WQG77949.1 M23 family metallopeptidase [Cellulophaga lytica]SNQ43998.1 Metallopeptidase, family M23 [Cellulophaga lytica]
MRIYAFIAALFLLTSVYGQEKYPQNKFQSPLDIPLILAGNFGELRSNHFHSGIDIKTQQREGLAVYAIDDASVTRIKISHWGYGKALYITHPSGYTSVYAHLQKFSPKIEEYIKKIQYKKQSYQVETFPDFGELKVKKGEVIAYSGNTGGSSGPHLHFEIRSNTTSKPTNPLLYGYDIRDATDPTILNLYAYPLSNDAQINRSANKTQIKFKRQADGSYLADKVYASGTIGIGFNGYDRQDMAANKNGIYAIEQLVNGKTYSKFKFDSFSFAETRYINTLIDYQHYGKYSQRIVKCFKDPSNKLSIYSDLHNDGKIVVNNGLTYNVELLLKDWENNTTKIIIPIEGKVQELKSPKKVATTDNYLIAKKPNNYNLEGAKVYFPANTFYNDFYIDLKKGKDTVKIHNNEVPAHRNFTITFDVSKYSDTEKKQLFIARLNSKNLPIHATTYKRGNTFTTRTKNLGTYTLAKDTIAPVITPKNFKAKQWLNNYKYLSLKIVDDLSGIDTYNAYINGEWVLMSYEYKTNTITYNFDDKILNKKECNLKVIVTDNVGNSTTYETTFYRK